MSRGLLPRRDQEVDQYGLQELAQLLLLGRESLLLLGREFLLLKHGLVYLRCGLVVLEQ